MFKRARNLILNLLSDVGRNHWINKLCLYICLNSGVTLKSSKRPGGKIKQAESHHRIFEIF